MKNPFAHLPREARDTLFLLAVIAWVILPQVGQLPLWCSLLTGVVLLWRGWLALGARPLPGRAWRIGLLAVAVLATWATYRTLLGREAGVTLIVLLLALKTLELRARRDAMVVFFLGFFVMLTNFFQSQSLPLALAMLLGLLGLLTALVNAHRPVGQPSLRESAALAAKMTLAGAPIMLALFVFFPRFAPLWGLPSDALTGRSGLSNTMEVGNVAELALDEGIALRVRFDGAPPPQQQLYFRGPVLSRFDGRSWSAASDLDALAFTRAAPAVQVLGAPIGYEMTLEPNHQRWLLTLDVAPRPPELPGGRRALPGPALQWLSSRPITDLLRFRVQSYPEFRYGPSPTPDGRVPPALAPELHLPPGGNPRTVALAAQLRQQHAGAEPMALVRAALERLRDGGYVYTLDPGVVGEHTADEFWFGSRQGFCEHIASAFVVLMRAAGVPARVVTGFQGGEMNGVDGYWTVRNADAHAWTEVWLAERGWVRIDPTAAVAPGRVGRLERLRAPPGAFAGAIGAFSPTLMAQLRANWEALNNRWNQSVLNYTQTRQFDLMRGLGFDSPSWDDLAKVLGTLLVLGATAGMLWTRWERRRHDPWLRLLERARLRLRQAGVAAPDQAPPRALKALADASALPPELREPLGAWLLALERLRYASADGRSATLATLGREFQRLRWPRPSP